MTNRGVAGTRVTLLVLRAQVELKASRTEVETRAQQTEPAMVEVRVNKDPERRSTVDRKG